MSENGDDGLTVGDQRSNPQGSYFCTECWRCHVYGKSENNWLWEEHRDHALTLPEEWQEPIADACLSAQKTREKLLTDYFVRGLERDGFEVDDGR